jgi:hypothetical protein
VDGRSKSGQDEEKPWGKPEDDEKEKARMRALFFCHARPAPAGAGLTQAF